MIRELYLENFVLVERVHLELAGGLTVVTGETGAGKSLLVKGLKLLAGARAEGRLLRDRDRPAVVQALFELPRDSHALAAADGLDQEALADLGIEPGAELVVRRVFRPDGKGRAYLDGAPVTLSLLSQVVGRLVGITSQHQYHSLLQRREQRRLLDAYAGIEKDVEALSLLWAEARELAEEISSLDSRMEEARLREEELRREAEAIDAVDPRPGEEEELERKRVLLRAARELSELGHAVFSRLYGEKGAVVELIQQCRSDLEKMSRKDEALDAMVGRAESLGYEAEDLAWAVREYVEGLPMDPASLEAVEERVFALRRLKRRFGPELEDVLAYRRQIDERLRQDADLSVRRQELADRLESLRAAMEEKAGEIHNKRSDAARRVEEAVLQELRDLNLKKCTFVVAVHGPETPTWEDIGPSGADRVEFLFSANPGKPPMPLAAVASGGELSRVMLALQVVFSREAGTRTVVFDEIDTGIGGEVAEMAGRKMQALADRCQVITITHFPQIAACGQGHFVVEKSESETGTVSKVRRVEGEERLQELIRMLGGEREAVKAYAQELLGTLFRGPR